MFPETRFFMSPTEEEIFEKMSRLIAAIPADNYEFECKVNFGHNAAGNPLGLTCHILAEAMAQKFQLKRIDGWHRLDISMGHSWCETTLGNIFDVYPVLAVCSGPLFIYRQEKSRTSKYGIDEIYITEKDTTDSRYPEEGNKHFKLNIFESIDKEDFEKCTNKLLAFFETIK